jgi:hypothetical protein
LILIREVKLHRAGEKPGHVNSAGKWELAPKPRQGIRIRAGSLADNRRIQ